MDRTERETERLHAEALATLKDQVEACRDRLDQAWRLALRAVERGDTTDRVEDLEHWVAGAAAQLAFALLEEPADRPAEPDPLPADYEPRVNDRFLLGWSNGSREWATVLRFDAAEVDDTGMAFPATMRVEVGAGELLLLEKVGDVWTEEEYHDEIPNITQLTRGVL